MIGGFLLLLLCNFQLGAKICRNQSNDKEPVSYTHLDVYKRQLLDGPNAVLALLGNLGRSLIQGGGILLDLSLIHISYGDILTKNLEIKLLD